MNESDKKEYFPEEVSLRLSGRTLYREKTLYLLHAASYIDFEFEGHLLEAELESEGGGEDYEAWVGIYINDMEQSYRRINLQKGNQRYLLWENSSREKVHIRIVKMSENQYAYTAVNKFIMDVDALIQKTPEKERRIEFVGDSITCGFGNEGQPEDEFATGTENPLKAYGVLTAEKLDCDYTLVAWSGIGILSSWVPPESEKPNTDKLISTRYPYVDYELFRKKGWTPMETYEYERDCCDAIVVNLGTNDASYTRDHAERIQKFRTAYQEFLRYLRLTHANIPIICTSGAMTQLLCNEIEEAVMTVRKTDRDEHIYYMKFSQSNSYLEDADGAVGHPSIKKHEKMAEQLSNFMKENRILKKSDI